jgi:Flp pilus assembly protein TadD
MLIVYYKAHRQGDKMNPLAQQGLVVIEGRATYERIAAYIREVEAEEAIRHIQNFLKIYPEFGQAHNDLAVLYYRSGNGMKALAHYEKAYKLEPSNVTFRKNLADFYFVELEWADDAIQTYLDILKDNPFDVETLNALGTISVQIGRREQARQYFSRTLQLDAVNSQARSALHQLGGQLPSPAQQPRIDAVSPFSSESPSLNIKFPQVSSDPPVNPHQRHKQALEILDSGNSTEARRLLEEILEIHPDLDVVQNDLGILYQQEGNVHQARYHLEKALCLQPDNLNYQKNFADLLYIAFGETEEALKLYVRILENNSHDIETLLVISRICIEIGQTADALTFLEAVLKIDPYNADALNAIAKLSDSTEHEPSTIPEQHTIDDIYAKAQQFVQQGQHIEAHALLEELVHNSSTNPLFQNDLGVLRYQLGDVEGAQTAYEQALVLDPANATFRKNLADLYFIELGRVDDAIEIYLELFRLYPRDLEVLSSLGTICVSIGRPEEAKAFIQRAIEIEPWDANLRLVLQNLQS